jgi:pterin-4a-carbinolamine dehydratase
MTEPMVSAETLPSAEVRRFVRTTDPADLVALRAARVRGSVARVALPAESVAERLADFPGWEVYPAGPGLARLYHFPTGGDAARFAVYVAGLLADLETEPTVELQGEMVSVRVWSLPGRDQVTERDFDLVALIEGRGELPR